MPDREVRLEFNPFPSEHKRMYVDIWLPSEEVAIELKFPTRKLDVEWCGGFAAAAAFLGRDAEADMDADRAVELGFNRYLMAAMLAEARRDRG